MVVKNILNAQNLKWKRHQKNVVRRIATLNHVESMSQKDPPRVEKLPKQRGAVFIQIPKRTVALFGHRMPVDMDPVNYFVLAGVPLATRTQHGHVISVRMQRSGFLPYARIKRDGQILYDNQDLFFQSRGRIPRVPCRAQPVRTTSSPVPSAMWESC